MEILRLGGKWVAQLNSTMWQASARVQEGLCQDHWTHPTGCGLLISAVYHLWGTQHSATALGVGQCATRPAGRGSLALAPSFSAGSHWCSFSLILWQTLSNCLNSTSKILTSIYLCNYFYYKKEILDLFIDLKLLIFIHYPPPQTPCLSTN